MKSSYKKVSGMTAEIKIRRCYGCGAILQGEDRFDVGYVSKKREGKDGGLCDRCYDLRHPSEGKNQTLDQAFADLLAEARKKGALFCYVFDSFSLDASLVPGLSDILGDNVLAIFSKRDILPAEYSDEALLKVFQSQLSVHGIHPLDFLLTSAYQAFNYDAFLKAIEKHRRGKDVYFVGASQVGKSALINNILMNYDNVTGRNITSERIGNEGLVLTEIPLDGEATLYDTPGIFNPHSILNQVERRALKYIIPVAPVTPVKETLKENESLLLGALGRVDNASLQGPLHLTLFFARDLIRTKVKVDKADLAFAELCQSGEGKPSSVTVKSMADLEEHRFTLADDHVCLISIFGFGKVVVRGQKGQDVVVYAPKNVSVNLYTDSAWVSL